MCWCLGSAHRSIVHMHAFIEISKHAHFLASTSITSFYKKEKFQHTLSNI